MCRACMHQACTLPQMCTHAEASSMMPGTPGGPSVQVHVGLMSLHVMQSSTAGSRALVTAPCRVGCMCREAVHAHLASHVRGSSCTCVAPYLAWAPWSLVVALQCG